MDKQALKLELIKLCHRPGMPAKETKEAAQELLDFVMLDDANNKPPTQVGNTKTKLKE